MLSYCLHTVNQLETHLNLGHCSACRQWNRQDKFRLLHCLADWLIQLALAKPAVKLRRSFPLCLLLNMAILSASHQVSQRDAFAACWPITGVPCFFICFSGHCRMLQDSLDDNLTCDAGCEALYSGQSVLCIPEADQGLKSANTYRPMTASVSSVETITATKTTIAGEISSTMARSSISTPIWQPDGQTGGQQRTCFLDGFGLLSVTIFSLFLLSFWVELARLLLGWLRFIDIFVQILSFHHVPVCCSFTLNWNLQDYFALVHVHMYIESARRFLH